jgi:hypothetical protein
VPNHLRTTQKEREEGKHQKLNLERKSFEKKKKTKTNSENTIRKNISEV